MPNRLTKKTPKFFRKLRNISLSLVAAGGSILALPTTHAIELPEIFVTIATILTTAGTVGAVVSQAVTTEEKE